MRHTLAGGVSRLIFVLLAVLSLAAPAAAKSYRAERFDACIKVMPGGALEVTETVAFRFESGTFDHVYRELRSRRTDGLEIVSATMDGRLFPAGDGIDQIKVTGSSKLRVRWQFLPVADSTHVFVLTYLVRGAVAQNPDADILVWRALPGEHRYPIGSSTVEFDLPESVLAANAATGATPKMEWHRIDGAVHAGVERSRPDTGASALIARATAREIRSNGWFEATFAFPRGSIVAAPPAWQQFHIDARTLAPRWLGAATLIVLAGMIVMFGLRQQYDPPPRDQSTVPGSATVPDALAPGLVGPLLANGRASLEHAMATFLGLADRGIVWIEERPPGLFGQRSFDIRTCQPRRPLTGHERALLDITFEQNTGCDAVPLSHVKRRLVRRFRQFNAAVHQELIAEGLIDADRARVRRRYSRVAMGVLILAALAVVGAGVSTGRYGAWPMLLPAAFGVVAVIGMIFAAATTPLSNEGVRRAAQWRAFRSYLKTTSQDRGQHPVAGLSGLLPFAVATGLAANWASYVKRHPGSVPTWFRALSSASQHSAFTAFVTSSAATHGAGAGGGDGGGGAAGGGSSGAG